MWSKLQPTRATFTVLTLRDDDGAVVEGAPHSSALAPPWCWYKSWRIINDWWLHFKLFSWYNLVHKNDTLSLVVQSSNRILKFTDSGPDSAELGDLAFVKPPPLCNWFILPLLRTNKTTKPMHLHVISEWTVCLSSYYIWNCLCWRRDLWRPDLWFPSISFSILFSSLAVR